MFKNKKFVKFCLRFMCWFRKIYSPVIFWLLWFLFIRWTISVEDKYAAKVIWEEMLHSSTIAEFREKLKRYDWLSERKGGLLDFTYRLPWLNFCGTVPARFGRDCDDFAELSWRWCEIHGVNKIWQIMSMGSTFKSAHVFTVAYSAGIFVVMSNAGASKYIAAESIEAAVNAYLKKNTVWSIYKYEEI